MKKIPVLLLVYIIVVACNRPAVEDHFARGKDALTNKNYKEAVANFDQVIASVPDYENALLLRSQANYGLKKYELAIKDCERILAINDKVATEDDLTAIWNLGVCYNSLRQFEKARKYFMLGLKYRPKNIKLFENIGYSYLEEKQYDLALAHFKKMVSIDNKSEIGLFAVGKAYYLKEDFESAIYAFSKAIELNPSYAMAYQNRGSAKFSLNDTQGGCEDWKKCLELGLVQVKPLIEQYCK